MRLGEDSRDKGLQQYDNVPKNSSQVRLFFFSFRPSSYSIFFFFILFTCRDSLRSSSILSFDLIPPSHIICLSPSGHLPSYSSPSPINPFCLQFVDHLTLSFSSLFTLIDFLVFPSPHSSQSSPPTR